MVIKVNFFSQFVIHGLEEILWRTLNFWMLVNILNYNSHYNSTSRQLNACIEEKCNFEYGHKLKGHV